MSPLRRHLHIHRPFILGTFFSLLGLSIFFLMAARFQNNVGWLVLGISLLAILSLFVITQIWFFIQLERKILPQINSWIIKKGRISSEDQILLPYIGESRLAEHLLKHLTVGKLWLVDVYTPQIMISGTTNRMRASDTPPEKDTRLKTIPGSIDILPFQDAELDVVILHHALSEITQFGDRHRFLQEINRVLKPNGKLLLLEPLKTQARIIVNPLDLYRLWSKEEWEYQLQISGFVRLELQTPSTLTILGRAAIPGRYETPQLPLEF